MLNMEPNTRSCNTASALKRARPPETDESTHEHQSHKMRKMNDLNVTDTTLVDDLPISGRDTDPETTSPTQTSLPPRASLQGLPRELRDQIYEQLAETEERIVLGWRFLQVWEHGDVSLSLDDCFDSAVALHPLSMTCKQMPADFQYIHFTATKARWTLSVNNFKLDQLELFGYYIDSGSFIEDITWMSSKACMSSRPVYNVDLAFRFQMDENAAGSAAELCGLVLSSDRDNYDTMRVVQRCTSITAEVAARYSYRTTAPSKRIQSMTAQDAISIDYWLISLRPEALLWDLRARTEWERCNLCDMMEEYWFKPFSRAVNDIEATRETGHKSLRPFYYTRGELWTLVKRSRSGLRFTVNIVR